MITPLCFQVNDRSAPCMRDTHMKCDPSQDQRNKVEENRLFCHSSALFKCFRFQVVELVLIFHLWQCCSKTFTSKKNCIYILHQMNSINGFTSRRDPKSHNGLLPLFRHTASWARSPTHFKAPEIPTPLLEGSNIYNSKKGLQSY